MKKYLLQTRFPDEVVGASMEYPHHIIEAYGFRDCTDFEYEVYSVNSFGEIIKLEHIPAVKAPFNYHQFLNPKTGEVEFEGYSTEH